MLTLGSLAIGSGQGSHTWSRSLHVCDRPSSLRWRALGNAVPLRTDDSGEHASRRRAPGWAASALVTTLALTGALAGPTVASTAAASAQTPTTAAATATDGIAHKQNDRVPKGSVWTQPYFPSSDGSGTELHGDLLTPEGVPAGQKVPIILSIGPYFGHMGQTNREGGPTPVPRIASRTSSRAATSSPTATRSSWSTCTASAARPAASTGAIP